ncbi:Chloroperoxidase [Usnea florida]
MAFPWMAGMPGIRSPSEVEAQLTERATTCPNNPNHVPAAPITSDFPYAGAIDGLPSTRPGNFQVPANGDTAHQFVPPGPNDIRGPCPGLNTAANHNFISHDGVTTFSELVDAQQNIYNAGYDLAVLLAVLGVELTGDPVTQKMSIGCDATSRTSPIGGLLGAEGGLDSHNARDASLTRGDFFFGDDHSFNATYFEQLTALAYTGGPKTDVINSYNYDQSVLAQHQFNRYQDSKAKNPSFYFGPKAILLYGAASFLYELFPSHGPAAPAIFLDIGSFYGTTNPDANGNIAFNNTEHIPIAPTGKPGWFSRTDAYNISALVVQVLDLYTAHPVLFGGNTGAGDFDALSFGAITDGQLSSNPQDILCLLYQLATDDVPDSLSSVLSLPSELLSFATSKLNPIFQNSGCTLLSPS